MGYEEGGQSSYKFYNALAEGLREGHGGLHLMTIAPIQGGSSGGFWQGVDWLSFNMCLGSGPVPLWTLTEMDYMRQPTKPTLPVLVAANKPGKEGELEWRKWAYRSLLAGGMGILSRPGGNTAQGHHLKKLMESRPLLQRVPDNRLLEKEPALNDDTRCQASGDMMGSYAMIYVPESSRKIVIRLDRLFSRKIKAWWFNPRDGSSASAGEYEKLEPTEFVSPPDGPDWVLVLDDAVKNYPPPGQPVVEKTPMAGAAKVP
jgi:hypothetical protein